ncbi:hypothetical protein MIT9_P2015 [Methylomarinovum caldicuralii]|uniref:CBS domain-containing protein n=1 Tax=Methylomarinovum caldicuralii TaxID=438856 RepID=A0AAU9CCX0_9GAMM|nr:CBS domain-containing protein [Methylomarinovum caldicuralii]BCX82429.1 hypothetical protein MIT9_P2015 [Methylomarinovum caldicuralii]
MADKTPAKTKKPKKERAYKTKVILWTVLLMVIDEITIGIPEADLVLFYVALARPKWFLEMMHKLYKYVPHRRAWRPVRDVCQRQVATVTADASVTEAVERMREAGVRSLVVIREQIYNPAAQVSQKKGWFGKRSRKKALPETTAAEAETSRVPVGMLSDRDVTLLVGAEGLSGEAVTVAEVMQDDIPLALEGEDLHSAVTKMREAGMRRLPVVDERGALAGLLSLDDTITVLSEGLNDMVDLLERETEREARQSA